MPFATPLALLGLLFLPVVLAIYLLKLRRERSVVPSTLLWSRLISDVEANAPWQRLRRTPLLLLQLLLVIILAMLAARPFVERPAGLARDLVLVIDTSASMAASDVIPNRLEVAKSKAIEALRDLPAGGKVSVIAAGQSARIVANGTTDLGRVRQAISSIVVEASVGDLGDGLNLANALAARSGDAEILVATDAALAVKPANRLDAPVRVIPVGRERDNQAIIALAIRTAPSGLTKSAFISIANLGLTGANRRLTVYADGLPIESRDLFIDPQARSDFVIDDITQQNTRTVNVIEVRLGADPTGGASKDQLSLDDRAWAIVPSNRPREILLVGDGDPYLETALSHLPSVALFGVRPGDYPAKAARADGTAWDLVVFEGKLPESLPATAILAIAPDRTSPLGEVAGSLANPGIGRINAAEPVLRYVDLSTLHVATAQKLILPDWARNLVPGPAGASLLYVGDRAGLPTAVLAFEPRQSDLPLQVAFPILLANLVGELLGASGGPVEPVRLGAPVALAIPSGATGLRVTRPDGSSVDLLPGTVGGTSVTFSQTEQLGVYAATPIRTAAGGPGSPAATQAPAARSPSAAPTPSTGASDSSPRATAGAGLEPRDADAPVRFAVDLFSPEESNIAPGQPIAIEQLGRLPGSPPSPGSSPAGSRSPTPSGPAVSPGASEAPAGVAATDPRPPARDELWGPILLIVLAALLVEWGVYQRDALLRLWRGLHAFRSGKATPGGSRRWG